jgi:hypothetical protein
MVEHMVGHMVGHKLQAVTVHGEVFLDLRLLDCDGSWWPWWEVVVVVSVDGG